MIHLALWVASAIFLTLCGMFLLGGIIQFFASGSSSKQTYREPIDPNAEIKSRVMEERQAVAGPRKDGESLVQYSERLTAVKL